MKKVVSVNNSLKCVNYTLCYFPGDQYMSKSSKVKKKKERNTCDLLSILKPPPYPRLAKPPTLRGPHHPPQDNVRVTLVWLIQVETISSSFERIKSLAVEA